MTDSVSPSPIHLTRKQTRRVPRKISFDDDEPNFEDFSLVWLNEKRDQCEIPSQIRSIINYFKLFYNIERCVKYILSIRTEKVFLIIPDTLWKTVIPRVHDHSHLEHIYIYCPRQMPDSLSIENYGKISGIFTDNKVLMTKLKEDYQSSSQNLCSTSIIIPEKKTTHIDRNNSTIDWFPFLIETVINTPQSNVIKKQLLSKCELDYIDNDLEQKSIDDFRQHYQSTDVLSWYKRDCFIYRLLNKAFRSQNITTLFKFRFFLFDMHHELTNLHSIFIKESPFQQNQLVLYRGQGIHVEELNKMKTSVGKLISINNYFLTTTNFQIAAERSTTGERNSSKESIIFHIIVNRSVANASKPFAPINETEEEKEILFSPGTIFQNQSIEQQDGIWHVKLLLVNEQQTKEKNQFMELLKRDYDYASSYTSLGYFLWKTGKYDKAEAIFSIIFDELRTFNHDQLSAIYNDIGYLYSDRSYYNKALDYFEKSIRHGKRNSSGNAAHISTVLNNIGLIHANKKKYTLALKYYKEALQMQLDIRDKKPANLINMAITYANTGYIYGEMRLFSQAMMNLEKALDIRLKELPANHPHIAQTYNCIGYIYFLQGYFKKALKSYNQALEINLISLTTNHPDLLKTYKYIGAAHFGEQKHPLAIEYYEKAIEIGIAALPHDHRTMVQLYQNVAFVYKAMKNHSMALKYFRKAVDIEKNRSKLDHALLFDLYAYVGNSYETVGKNSLALNQYRTSVQHGFKMKSQNYSRIHTMHGAIQRCLNREDHAAAKNAKK